MHLQALIFLLFLSSSSFADGPETKHLTVGKELLGEILDLKSGTRLYLLADLKARTWYEVKISYPASSELSVLVTVEPEGVVAIPLAAERKEVIFNIVCDELLLGIPRQAWWIGVMGIGCLGLGLGAPKFIPSNLLAKKGYSSVISNDIPKES